MSERTIGSTNADPGAGLPDPVTVATEKSHGAARMLGVAAVCAGVIALAAATFVLSYSGIHQLALQAGVAPRLARGYPLIVDVMLVIVLAAVLSLRGAGVPSKLFAWVTLIVVLAAAASANALHAAGRKLPEHVGAVVAAVVPWVLVLLAFALLLTMLRFARARRQAGARRAAMHGQAAAASTQPAPVAETTQPAALLQPPVSAEPGQPAVAAEADERTAESAAPEDLAAQAPQPAVPAKTGDRPAAEAGDQPAAMPAVLSIPRQPGPTAVADADPAFAAAADPGLAVDSVVLSHDDPTSDEATADEAGLSARQPGDSTYASLSDSPHASVSDSEDASVSDSEDDDEAGMPAFHRMWSSPTPPPGM